MSDLIFKGTGAQRSFVRKTPEPIDATSTFATYADAVQYALDNDTYTYCPYAGQLIVTLAGGVDKDGNELTSADEGYANARLWRLKVGAVNAKGRQGYELEEILGADRVADTTEHNEFQGGTQTFGAWIELLAGMTMGYSLATERVNGETVVKIDPVTGKVMRIDDDGREAVIDDDDERIWLDGQGKGHMVISAIKVLGKMEVHEIDVNHIKHTGGLFVNSRANLIVSDVTEQTGGYTKLSFVQRNADGMAIYNLFEAGDLALSMTFNVVKEGVSQPTGDEVVRFYWREVDSIGTDSQSGTGYIILKPVPSAYQSYMSTPQVGDSVVQVGHVDAPSGSDETTVNHVKSRQGLQCMGFSHTNGPYIAEYDGINSVAASVNFDRPDDAIVYLSPKYHKLQGDVIKLKATSQQGSTDLTLTADTIKTITQNLSVIANILDIQAGNVSATINGLDGRIEANAQNIALKADNKWLLKMTKDSAGMYVVGENGEAINSGRMILVANTDGSIGAVTIADNGQMEYTGDFTLKAKNIDFTADAINLNTTSFVVGTETKRLLETVYDEEIGGYATYIRTDLLNVKALQAESVEAAKLKATEIVDAALITTASFDAKGATIRNLKVTGNSIFQGHLDGVDGTFSGQLSSVTGEFNGKVVIAGGKILIDGNEVGVTNDGTQMHIGVNGLIAKVANEQNQYLLATTNGITMQWINDGLRLSQNGLERYDGSSWVNMFSEEKARTIEGATTLDVKDGIVVCTKMESHYTVTLPPTSTELVDGKTIQIIATDTTKNHYIVVKPNSNQRITTSAAGNNENGGRKLLHANRCWVTYLNGFWHFSATGGSDA